MAIWSTGRQSLNSNNTDQYEVVMMADKDGNLINTFGAASNIQISEGLLEGFQDVHKFGMVDGSTGTGYNTVWSPGDTVSTTKYPWEIAAGTLSVVSTSADDTNGDVGAWEIKVEGLDTDYNQVEETFVLNGTTETAEGSIIFHRVYRAYVTEGNTNVGNIEIRNGTYLVARIDSDMGQTLMCTFTIPAGKTGYLTRLAASSSKNISTNISLFQRPYGKAFMRTASSMSLYQNNKVILYDIPLRFPEKTDIDLRHEGAANNVLSADFNIILVDHGTLV